MKPSARWLLATFLIVAALLVPNVVLAQNPDEPALRWREERSTHFAILYPDGEEAEAVRYAAFVDTVYDDLSVLFDHRLETPITLRLYPTLASYEEINPLASEVRGVIAHAQLNRREIAVLVPRTVNLTDEEVVNNIRHELTHLIVGDLSGNRLPTGFHEGIAQYVERPGRDQAAKVELLRQAHDAGRLLSWSELNAGPTVYQNPEIGYSQAVSIVSYLVDEYGFARFVEFIRALRATSGYRSALQATYGVPADRLERAWLDALPAYLDGRWQVNALWAYDLAPLQALVAEGAYASAESGLEEAIRLLEHSRQTDTLAEARRLLAVSQQGQTAGEAVVAARQALIDGEYAVARAKIALARTIYAELGDRRHEVELDELDAWANDGMDALDRLAAAEAAVRTNRLEQARQLATEAGVTLSTLGHGEGAAQSSAILAAIDRRQRAGALGLMGAGLLGLAANVLLRWRDHHLGRTGWAGSVQ